MFCYLVLSFSAVHLCVGGNMAVYTGAGNRSGTWPMSVDVCMKDKTHFLVYFLMLMKFCMWLGLEQESKGDGKDPGSGH